MLGLVFAPLLFLLAAVLLWASAQAWWLWLCTTEGLVLLWLLGGVATVILGAVLITALRVSLAPKK